MSVDLRIPLAALPGFDPVGLLVRDAETPNVWVLFCADELRCIVGDPTTGAARSRLLDRVVLDLSDSATRDRVARWVAGRVGLEVGCTAPRFELRPDYVKTWWPWPPGLDGLDLATPDTLLPDGSRQVDAIALGRVAVHLGAR